MRILLMSIMLAISAIVAGAQTRSLSGKVLDENDEALILSLIHI